MSSVVTTGVQEVMDSIWARAETVLGAGVGEVRTSARKKTRYEKKRALHGGAIWNILRSKGNDPGDYDPQVFMDAISDFVGRTERLLTTVGRTGRPNRRAIQRNVLRVAEILAEWSRQNVESGGLGQNAGKYRGLKIGLTRAGVFDATHGTPGPRGWATGRFARGIVSRWRLGGREKHADRLRVARAVRRGRGG